MRYADRSTPAGSGAGSPSVTSSTVRPLARACSTRPPSAVHPGLRRQRRVGVGPAQDAERAAHLVQRVAARALDRLERLARALGVAVEHPPRALGLRDHHADAVRDDVVQLARDPRALLADGDALALALLALEQRHALRARADAAADEPRRGDDQAAGEQEALDVRCSVAITVIHSPATPSAAPASAADPRRARRASRT